MVALKFLTDTGLSNHFDVIAVPDEQVLYTMLKAVVGGGGSYNWSQKYLVMFLKSLTVQFW